jgi:hypothetical protein
MQKKGEYDAAKEAANIERSGAWTKGLDAFTKSALPAAQSVHGMRIANRQATEQEKSGEVNRLNTMENAARTRQQRELDDRFAAPERQGGIDQTAATTKNLLTQNAGMETANKSANINLQKQELQQAFEQADAAKYGFEGANPGESVAQYTMRMDAEGKIADVQKVKAESKKIQLEAEQMPEELKLRTLNTLASINSLKAQTANMYTQSKIAQEDAKRRGETHNLDLYNQKIAMTEKETADFTKGVVSGTLYGQQPPEVQTELIARFVTDQNKKFGFNQDIMAATSRALAQNASDTKSAKIASDAAALLSPPQKAQIDRDIQQKRLADTGTTLLVNLNAKIKQYDESGRLWNSEKSKLAAEEIQATLDSAAAQEPRFQVYANKFREINAGAWAPGIAGVKNLFGDSPQTQAKALVASIARTLQTELEANPMAHPLTADTLQMSLQNFKNKSNIFYRTHFSQPPATPPRQPAPMQPAPQQPLFPVQTQSLVNKPQYNGELDQMFPQARR